MAVSAWKNITVLRGIAMLFVVLNRFSVLCLVMGRAAGALGVSCTRNPLHAGVILF